MALSAGARITISGLARHGLNGRTGTAMRLGLDDRWVVALDGDLTQLSIKPENLLVGAGSRPAVHIDDDEPEITGVRGDDTLRNAPHARFDCVACVFDRYDEAKARQTCAQCYCWVCDEPARACKQWASHCTCDGSPEFATLRQNEQRRRAREAQLRGSGPAADEVDERYERAAEAAGGAARPTGGGKGGEDADAAEDEEQEELFEEYQPLHLDRGQPHPDAVVETTSLAFASLPAAFARDLRLPATIYKPRTAANPLGAALSRLQLETVAYACERHNSTTLRGGERGGFFLGDGVGLGKGRQLAALVYAAACHPSRPAPHTRPCPLPRPPPRTPGPTPGPAARRRWHNVLQGRQAGCALQQRAVWLSVSRDLGVDARRDLDDIGATDVPLHHLVKLPYGPIERMPRQEEGRAPGGGGGSGPERITSGVLFVTYSALVGSNRSGQSRLEQVTMVSTIAILTVATLTVATLTVWPRAGRRVVGRRQGGGLHPLRREPQGQAPRRGRRGGRRRGGRRRRRRRWRRRRRRRRARRRASQEGKQQQDRGVRGRAAGALPARARRLLLGHRRLGRRAYVLHAAAGAV